MLGARTRHIARHPVQSTIRIAAHALVRAQTGGRVVDGPFAGMWYALPVPHLPAYLGTYELELRPLLAELSDTRFDVVLNVGAADGYYAGGLARLWPAARVVAFELIAAKQANVRRVAAENGVGERLQVEGGCTPGRLDELTRGSERPLVWMDVDGAEMELLDPELAPGLRRAEIVVELHEYLVPRAREILEARFASTHQGDLMQERRSAPQDWLHLRPSRPRAQGARTRAYTSSTRSSAASHG
jgi:hypothetical protein